MIRLQGWFLSLIRRIDPEAARRISRGWGWHLVALAAMLYLAAGIEIRTSIDNLVLFVAAIPVALVMMYYAHMSFISRPTIEDQSHLLWVEYHRYRVALMCAGVLAVGMFF